MVTQNNYGPHFGQAIEKLLEDEGGYVDNPDDAGGATKYGISLRWFKKIHRAATKADIALISKRDAIELYHEHWWLKHGYNNLPYPINIKVFNTSVNVGPKQAHKFLQRAVWAATGHMSLADDGIIGVKTVRTVRTCDPYDLLAAYRSEQAGFYRQIASKASQKQFLKGWLKRAYTS